MNHPNWLRSCRLAFVLIAGGVRAATFQLVSPTMDVWEDAGAVQVVVWREAGAGETASVEYVTHDLTAVAGRDYEATNGVLTFASEDLYRVIRVPVINNSRADGSRTFEIQLRNPLGGDLLASGTNTTVTVVDDDRGFDCPLREVSVGEACRWVWVSVIRQGDAGQAAAVGYSTLDDSARAGEDYVATNGVLHFVAGEAEKFVGVSVLNDGFAESQEAFLVRLEALEGGAPVVEGATARVRIEDNDQAVALVAGSTWVQEDVGSVVLSVIRNDDGVGQVSMDFATVDQAAKAGEDYVATNGTLVFAPGELRKEIAVRVLNDGVGEPGETLQVVLSDFVGLSGNWQSAATLYIEDNDPGVFFESTYVYANESDAEVVLCVTRRDDAPGPITVSYTTVDGDARAGLDFVGTNGVLTFESSGVSRQVRVRLINDLAREDSENFKVMLRKESGSLPAGWVAEATVVVTDNDTGITVDGGGWVSEAAGVVTFGIRCQEDVSGPVAVDFATVDGTATAGLDYTRTNGAVTLRGGERRVISVPILNDGLTEGYETFRFGLANPTAGIDLGGSASVDVTIEDNDPGVSFVQSDPYVTEGAGEAVLRVQRRDDSDATLVLGYATRDGSALAGSDYLARSGELILGPGGEVQEIVVPLVNDLEKEVSEQFAVILTNVAAEPVPGLPAMATVTLGASDPGFEFVWTDSSVLETSRRVTLTVTRGEDAGQPCSVEFRTEDGTALAGKDYVATNGTLTFRAGEQQKTISVAVVSDEEPESEETFYVQLLNPSGGVSLGGGARASVRISADPGQGGAWVQWHSWWTWCGEGDGTVSLALARTGDLRRGASVDYWTVDGTAVGGQDYVPAHGTVVFLPGQESQIVSVQLLEDDICEASEDVKVRLGNPTGGLAISGVGEASLQISDDDRGLYWESTYYVVEEDVAWAALTVRKQSDFGGPVAVHYSTVDGTARAGTDFVATNGLLVLEPGQLSGQVRVAILNDGSRESEESFGVVLWTDEAGVQVGLGAKATVQIQDNDPGVTFSFSSLWTTESDPGVRLELRRQDDLPGPVTVRYETVDGTAKAGSDYVATSGSVTFEVGQTQAEVVVPLLNDADRESAESFSVRLTGVEGEGAIGDPKSVEIMVQDNDPGLHFQENWVGVEEGQVKARLTLVREDDLPGPVTVRVVTEDGDAVAGSDYGAVDELITLDARGSRVVEVRIFNDGLAEGYEGFSVRLSAVDGGWIAPGGGTATVRIADNDPGILIDSAYLYVTESVGGVRVVVRAQTDLPGPFTVDYATVAGLAKAGEDYVATNGTLVFETGTEVTEILVPIINDGLREPSEYFYVRLSNPSSGVAIAGVGQTPVTINDDDPGIQLVSYGASVNEAWGTVSLVVRREDDMPGPATVRVSTWDGTAVAGEDYGGVDRVIALAARGSQAEVRVPLINDGVKEPDETFTVELSDAEGSWVNPTQGMAEVTIRDNDAGVSFESSSVLAREGQGDLLLRVRREDDNPGVVSVDYETEDDTARAGRDYAAIHGSLTFRPGEGSKTLAVRILNNSLSEPQKRFRVRLSNPVGGSLSVPDVMTVTVEDNDEVHLEGLQGVGEGRGPARVTVRRGDAGGTLSVDLFTSDGSATAGLDYVGTNVTVRFAEGETRKSVAIGILNDGLIEGDEWFQVALSNVVGGAVLSPPFAGTVYIQDNDSRPSLQQVSWDERAGATNLVVVRGNDGATPERVAYTVVGGTATRGADYVLADGVVELASGESAGLVPFTVLQDPWVELTETVEVRLRSELSGVTNSVVLEIADDEVPLVQDGGFQPQKAGAADVMAWLAQADGRLVVSCRSATGESWVGRLLPDGSRDPSFQTFQTNVLVNALAMQSDGRVICGGTNRVFRLLADGAWDSSFSAFLGEARLVRLAVLPGDRIGLVLQDQNQPAELRVRLCEPDGDWYPGFAETRVRVSLWGEWGGGSMVSCFQAHAGGILVGGRILAVDGDAGVNGLVRLAAAGGADATFRNALGSDGGDVRVYAVAVDEQERILVSGSNVNIHGEDWGGVVRLLSDGRADASFRCDGLVDAGVSVLALEPGGSVLAGSGSGYSTFRDQGLVRLSATGQLDRTLPAFPRLSPIAQIHMLPGGMAYVSTGLGWDAQNGFEESRIQRVFLHPETAVGVEFAGPQQVQVREDAGSASWTVRRLGNTAGVLTVRYSTRDESATAGLDYEVAMGTLVFGPGEHEKTITVRVLEDGDLEASESFWLELEPVTPGAVLGPNPVGYASIEDNEEPASQDHGFGGDREYYPIHDMVMQADGRLVAAVTLGRRMEESQLAVVRLDEQGRLDPAFQVFPIADNSVHLALTPDGRVVVGSWQRTTNGTLADVLLRLLPDGQVDPGFEAVTVDSMIAGLAVDPWSRIWLTRWDSGSGSGVFRLERLMPDGQVDGTFSPLDLGTDVGLPALPSSSGGAVVVRDRSSVARLTDSGAEDSGFHQPVFEVQGGGSASIQGLMGGPGGIVFVRGSFSMADGVSAAGLARLRANGTVDQEFTRNAAGVGRGPVQDMGLDHAGRVLVACYTSGWNTSGRLILRLKPDGTFDPGFRPVAVSGGPGETRLEALVADAADNVVAGGNFRTVDGDPWASLARFFERTPGSTIELADSELWVAEGANVAQVRLVRRGNVGSGAWVRWHTGGGTAAEGADFLGCGGVVEFGPLETARTFQVPLVDDVVEEPEEWFAVTLVESGGATLAGPARGRVWLVDNDGFGSLDLAMAGPYAPLAAVRDAEVRGMALQPGGRLLIWGSLETNAWSTTQASWGVHRLNPDGSRDWSFSAPPGFESIVGFRRDGRMVAFVAGSLVLLSQEGAVELAMLDASGAAVSRGIVDGEDRIFLVRREYGDRDWQEHLERYRAEGVPDPSFAREYFPPEETVDRLVPLRDGRMLLVGQFAIDAGQRCCLKVVKADGTVDARFVGGWFPDGSYLETAAECPDGTLLVGGRFGVQGQPEAFTGVMRLTQDGMVDRTFAGGVGAAGWQGPYVTTVLPLWDGRVLVAGRFSSYDGAACSGVVVLDQTGGGAIPLGGTEGLWHYDWATRGWSEGVFQAAAISGGRLWLGGWFNQYAGQDRALLVSLAVTPPLGFEGMQILQEGYFRFGLGVQQGHTYVLEGSEDLRGWTPLSTNTAATDRIWFHDLDAPGNPRMFFRAIRR